MTKKKKIVFLTGAGVSAESGIPTFRASDGLWEGHDIMTVATPEGWKADKALVLDFYNERRKNALSVKPNKGHQLIAELEQDFEVTVITQNVDNLHEKAGSSNVLHLHGELFKSRSTVDEKLVYDVEGWELKLGNKCEKGSQLRPHIVWFGEQVPMMETAAEITNQADIFIVVGTSLVVYPAASLLDYVEEDVPKYIIDPNMPKVTSQENLFLFEEIGSTGMEKVAKKLRKLYL